MYKASPDWLCCVPPALVLGPLDGFETPEGLFCCWPSLEGFGGMDEVGFGASSRRCSASSSSLGLFSPTTGEFVGFTTSTLLSSGA